MVTDSEKAAIFYNRAAELRGIADKVKDPETRNAMIGWAESYEALARRIIQASQSEDPGTPETGAAISLRDSTSRG